MCVCVCVCLVEGKVCAVEQSLGSLAMEAITVLLTANNSNAGKCTSHTMHICRSHLLITLSFIGVTNVTLSIYRWFIRYCSTDAGLQHITNICTEMDCHSLLSLM